MSATLDLDADGLIDGIVEFLGDDLLAAEDVRAALRREVHLAGRQALLDLKTRLAAAGADWDFYPRDPLARRIHHVLADRLLTPGSTVTGAEHAAAVEGRLAVVFGNHLSYADANLIEILLHRCGGEALAGRLTAMAGPKVYSSRKRRFSSLCFGTIKTPQSSTVSSEDAVMSARDVARTARKVIEMACGRIRLGDALLVFAEGTRSRQREMQRMLPAATRYLGVPDTWILPVGITGTEALFPVGEDTLHPVEIVVHVGRPIETARLLARTGTDRRLTMDTIGAAIAELLPPDYQGAYGATEAGLDEARRVLDALRD